MGFPIKVVETLKQIFADTLGGEEVRFEEETETIFSLRCEETDEWIAVVAATSDSQALADAEEARSMDPPPERVIAVCQKAGVHRKKLADMFAFDECELMYNVMKHSTVPPVTKLTDSEKDELRTLVCDEDMPMMLSDDIVARYYGFVEGDVVRTVRDTDSGPMTHHRLVMNR